MNESHLIWNWTIGLLVDGRPITINGTLSWSPVGSGLAEAFFVAVCVVGTIGVLCAIAVEGRRRPNLGI